MIKVFVLNQTHSIVHPMNHPVKCFNNNRLLHLPHLQRNIYIFRFSTNIFQFSTKYFSIFDQIFDQILFNFRPIIFQFSTNTLPSSTRIFQSWTRIFQSSTIFSNFRPNIIQFSTNYFSIFDQYFSIFDQYFSIFDQLFFDLRPIFFNFRPIFFNFRPILLNQILFSRKLRPSPLELSNNIELTVDDTEEETVGGNAQELLTWARECTKYSSMVNVTNLTSSFRSGKFILDLTSRWSKSHFL